MKKVYKYTLDTMQTYTLSIPVGGKIVFVDEQASRPTLWIEIDPNTTIKEARTFEIYGTGHEVKEGRVHVGSYKHGPFIWHVYEIIS